MVLYAVLLFRQVVVYMVVGKKFYKQEMIFQIKAGFFNKLLLCTVFCIFSTLRWITKMESGIINYTQFQSRNV